MFSAQVLHLAKVVVMLSASAGGMLQTDAQGQLDAQRDLFERQRDFALNQYGVFGNLLGDVPNVGQVRPSTTANPYTAALSGAMMGAGFGGNVMDYFGKGSVQPSYCQSAIDPNVLSAGVVNHVARDTFRPHAASPDTPRHS